MKAALASRIPTRWLIAAAGLGFWMLVTTVADSLHYGEDISRIGFLQSWALTWLTVGAVWGAARGGTR